MTYAVIIDPKQVIYKVLSDRYNSLNLQYPTKLKVKVTLSFAQILADVDKYDLISISRTSAPAEQPFIGDLFKSYIDTNADLFRQEKSNFQSDYYQIKKDIGL